MAMIKDIKDIIEGLRIIRPHASQLRIFGMILAAALVLLPAFSGVWPAPLWLWLLAGGIFFLALIGPRFLRPIHFLFMVLAIPVGWIISRILLTILFLLIITPIGFLLRVLGKDPLKRKWSKDESYWEPFEKNQHPDSMGL